MDAAGHVVVEASKCNTAPAAVQRWHSVFRQHFSCHPWQRHASYNPTPQIYTCGLLVAAQATATPTCRPLLQQHVFARILPRNAASGPG